MGFVLELEVALTDIAVIRTTFETLDLYPGDLDLRTELMSLVVAARSNLVRRLMEFQNQIQSAATGIRDAELQEFKSQVLKLARQGHSRPTLDRMMAVDVFRANNGSGPVYKYKFLPQHSLPEIELLSPLNFTVRVFADLLDEVTDERHFTDRIRFDAHVFQKYVAAMFCMYAVTDPIYFKSSDDE